MMVSYFFGDTLIGPCILPVRGQGHCWLNWLRSLACSVVRANCCNAGQWRWCTSVLQCTSQCCFLSVFANMAVRLNLPTISRSSARFGLTSPKVFCRPGVSLYWPTQDRPVEFW